MIKKIIIFLIIFILVKFFLERFLTNCIIKKLNN